VTRVKKKKKKCWPVCFHGREREFFIDNLLVRIHFIIVLIRRTGLAPWEFEFPFPGSLTSTFLVEALRPTVHGLRFTVDPSPEP